MKSFSTKGDTPGDRSNAFFWDYRLARILKHPGTEPGDLLELQQGSWKLFTAVSRQCRALNFDVSLGSSSIALSRNCREVVCVVPDTTIADFVRDRLRHAGVENVTLLPPGDPEAWPLERESYSLIAMDHVERFHLAFLDRFSTPQREGLLSRLAAALEPTGRLYVGQEIQRGLPLLEIRRSLGKMGFPVRRFTTRRHVAFYPDRERTKLILPLSFPPRSLSDLKETAKLYLGKHRSTGHLLHPRGGPGSGEIDLVDRIVDRITGATGLPGPGAIRLFVGSGSAMVLKTKDWIARLPQGPLAENRCLKNHSSLVQLESLRLPVDVPRPLLQDCIDGQRFTVESRIAGEESIAPGWMDQAFDLLHRFHEATAERTEWSSADVERIFRAPMDRIESYFDDPKYATEIRELGDWLIDRLTCRPRTLVWNHGDFKRSNILLEGEKPRSLIDWDLSIPRGLPLTDWIHCWSWEEALRTGASMPRLYREFSMERARPADGLSRYMKRFEVEPEEIEPFKLYTLMRIVANHLIILEQRAVHLKAIEELLEFFRVVSDRSR